MVSRTTKPQPENVASPSRAGGQGAGPERFPRSSDRLLSGEPIFRVAGGGPAAEWAAELIHSLGGRSERGPGERSPHPALAWARCGAMALTGFADGPPRLAPGPLASRAAGAARALAALAGERWTGDVDGAALLGERAAIFGLARRGTVSPGGSCRLLPTEDAWIAVNLARPEDVELLPAWLGNGAREDPWRGVASGLRTQPAGDVVERARLLGLPVAVVVDPAPEVPNWCRVAARGTAAQRRLSGAPRVIDLSSLWAGPLCSHLLGLAGARVLKVESTRRPDGARYGPAEFFDLMNAGKASVALDFGDESGRRQLRRLVEHADIIVESARPRALAQLGLDAAALVEEIPGLTWVSITGYGRREPEAGWVAFGDDAAAASGLAAATGPAGGPPLFCGDAIADPLTGLHAAVAALASWTCGGGHLLDLSLCDVTAHVLGGGDPASPATVREGVSGWEVAAGGLRAAVTPPAARRPVGAARPLGADTAAVLDEFGIPC